MQASYRAATTSLLLAAGLAVSGGAASASGTHQSAKAVPHLTVTVVSSGKGIALSSTTFRPGRTTFAVKRARQGGGQIQVFRLRSGYPLSKAAADFGKAFPQGNTPANVAAVRRIDKNVVFYGGIDVPRPGKPENHWATDIDRAGTYYVINTSNNKLTTFHAKGTHQRRSWPAVSGRLNMAKGNVWAPGSNDAHRGWLSTTNNAAEPHFVVLQHVVQGTTVQDVMNALNGGPNPSASDNAQAGEGIVSPGHTVRWQVRLPAGEYAVMCFYPSKVNGMPHAFMGMVDVFQLN